MLTYFKGDRYTTPESTPRMLLDRLLPGSRWALYTGLALAVLEARKASLRGVYDDTYWAYSSFRVFRTIEKCGGRFEIAGFDNLRGVTPPVVFIANHMSTLETQILPVLIAPFMRVTFVVKEQLVRGKVFGPIMRSRNPITVTRKNPGQDLRVVLSEGEKRLESGISVIVFPQSTRDERFNTTKLNSLGAKLAKRCDVPVVPVALKTDFWTNGRILRGFGPIYRDRIIHFAFGEPVDSRNPSKKVHSRTVEFIGDKLSAWGMQVT